MISNTTAHIARRNEGAHILFGSDVVTLKAGRDTTSGSLLVFELRVGAVGGPPALQLHAYSEVFDLLECEFEIRTLDTDNQLHTTKLTAGDTIAIPSLVWHTFQNVGAATGTLLS